MADLEESKLENTLMATTGKCVNGHDLPTDAHFHSCPICSASESSVAIEPRREIFPHAGVPGATDFNQVLTIWKEKFGLTAHDVARADTLQYIDIVHDPLDGKLTWQSSGPMDGLMAILLTIQAAMSMGEYFMQGAGQVDMPTGEVGIVMGFKDGRLSIAVHPEGEQLAAEKLLAAVLAYFWTKNNGNPLERFLKAFGWGTANGNS